MSKKQQQSKRKKERKKEREKEEEREAGERNKQIFLFTGVMCQSEGAPGRPGTAYLTPGRVGVWVAAGAPQAGRPGGVCRRVVVAYGKW